MRTILALSLSALSLVTLSAASVNRSAPISQDVCDELPVPFTVPASVETDSDLTEWLAQESGSYCGVAGNASTSWCACFVAGMIRD